MKFCPGCCDFSGNPAINPQLDTMKQCQCKDYLKFHQELQIEIWTLRTTITYTYVAQHIYSMHASQFPELLRILQYSHMFLILVLKVVLYCPLMVWKRIWRKVKTKQSRTLNKEQNKYKYTLITLNNKRKKMCVAVGSQKQYIIIHMYNRIFLY